MPGDAAQVGQRYVEARPLLQGRPDRFEAGRDLRGPDREGAQCPPSSSRGRRPRPRAPGDLLGVVGRHELRVRDVQERRALDVGRPGGPDVLDRRAARLSPVSVMSSTTRTRWSFTGPERPSVSVAAPVGVAVTPQCWARRETTRWTPRRSARSRAGHPASAGQADDRLRRDRSARTRSSRLSAHRSTSAQVAARQRGRSPIAAPSTYG